MMHTKIHWIQGIEIQGTQDIHRNHVGWTDSEDADPRDSYDSNVFKKISRIQIRWSLGDSGGFRWFRRFRSKGCRSHQIHSDSGDSNESSDIKSADLRKSVRFRWFKFGGFRRLCRLGPGGFRCIRKIILTERENNWFQILPGHPRDSPKWLPSTRE